MHASPAADATPTGQLWALLCRSTLVVGTPAGPVTVQPCRPGAFLATPIAPGLASLEVVPGPGVGSIEALVDLVRAACAGPILSQAGPAR